MKITDIELRFPEGQRPITIVTFDKPILHARMRWAAAYEDTYNVHVWRGEDGDYARCGVEKPVRKGFRKHRLTMMDGTTRLAYALEPTNEVAVNALFRMLPPVMECIIDDVEQGAIKGHVLVDSVAKYLWASYTREGVTEAPCMACIEWPSGVRVYEPVIAKHNGEQWDTDVNRKDSGDKIVFVATPGDPLTPILVALHNMKEQGLTQG